MAALRPSMQAISTEPPTPLHLAYTEKLNAYMEQAVPQESKDRQQKRIAILSDLTSTFKQWVHSVCLAKGLAQPVAEAAGGALFTSGSYRLGLNEVGMDIDAVCVAPRMVTRDDFFETLKVILEDHESIHNLVAIAGAAVPIITFDYGDINIDLMFAQLPVDSVPPTIDINADSALQGLDTGTQRSLNGPRVTNLIERLVPQFDAFRQLLRCIRLWAKRRGIYSNKMSYLGGINCNLLCAFLCQLYPRACASLLLERFFFILKDWNWPTPIMLTPPTDAGYTDTDGRMYEVWDSQGRGRYDQMPILTPAYPSMNSSLSVSQVSLEVMRSEMAIAHQRVVSILAAGASDWAPLYEPTDFWVAHSKYLAVEVYVQGAPAGLQQDLVRSWVGYTESQVKKLVDFLSYLPLAALRLMPRKLPLLSVGAAAAPPADSASAPPPCDGGSYLIGFDVDKTRMQGGELHMTNKVEAFRAELYDRAANQAIVTATTAPFLKVRFSVYGSWKELPEAVLDAGLGGIANAKAARKRVLEARRRRRRTA